MKDRYIGWAHVSDYGDNFGESLAKVLCQYANFDLDIKYAQSTELTGKIVFSALVIAREPAPK